jgi:hypothetical protein
LSFRTVIGTSSTNRSSSGSIRPRASRSSSAARRPGTSSTSSVSTARAAFPSRERPSASTGPSLASPRPTTSRSSESTRAGWSCSRSCLIIPQIQPPPLWGMLVGGGRRPPAIRIKRVVCLRSSLLAQPAPRPLPTLPTRGRA